jgi:hypothetical protein
LLFVEEETQNAALRGCDRKIAMILSCRTNHFSTTQAINSASREPTSQCWAPGALSSGQRFQPSKRNPLCAVATNARPPALGQDEWSESVKRLRGTRGQR